MPTTRAVLAVTATIVALVASVMLADPSSAASPLAVGMTTTEVVVTGVTPHQKIGLFGVVRDIVDFGETMRVRAEILSDDNGDGEIRYDLPSGGRERSVWTAVDFASGAFKAAHSVDLDVPTLKDGEIFTLPTPVQYVFLVRPSRGYAWLARVGDAPQKSYDQLLSGSDASGLAFEQVEPGAAPPGEFADGDVVVTVAADTFMFTAGTIQSCTKCP